jgi:hypothetical protein
LEDFNQQGETAGSDISESSENNGDEDEIPPTYISESNLVKLASELRGIYADNRSESSGHDEELSEWSSDGDQCTGNDQENQKNPILMYWEMEPGLSTLNSLTGSARCLQPKFDIPWQALQPITLGHIPLEQPCMLGVACLTRENSATNQSANRYSMTDEDSVVREVLQMLSGLPGQLFYRVDRDEGISADYETMCREYFPDRTQSIPFESIFLPRKDIFVTHLSPSALLSILSKFGQQGTMLYYIGQACKRYIFPQSKSSIPRGCSTLHAFFASVQVFLREFECFLQELLHVLIQKTSTNLPSLPTIEALTATAKCCAHSTSITLLSLKFLLQSHVVLVEDLCDICEKILQPEISELSNAEQASHLLQLVYSILHESKISGDSSRVNFLAKLFSDSFTPYVMIIDDWLFHGSLLSDIHNEFFIRCLDGSSAQNSVAEPGVGQGIQFWQKFAIRTGGKRIHAGQLRGATTDYLTLGLSASASDNYYAGMAIAVDLNGNGSIHESGIITAYFGAKRRAVVEFGKKISLVEGRPYIISTLVPKFLQDLAFHVLSAGKSLNVLILESDSNSRMYELVHQEPSLFQRFARFIAMNSEHMPCFDHRWPVSTQQGGENLCVQGNVERIVTSQREKISKRDLYFESNYILGASEGPDADLKGLFVSSLEDSDVWAEASDTMISEFSFENKSSKVTSLPSSSLDSFLYHGGSTVGSRNSCTNVSGSQNQSSRAFLESNDVPHFSREALLLPQLLDECFLRHVKDRVRELNSALVKHLLERHLLISHLAALRRIFFMEAGDILHAFSLELFRKLDRGESWGDAHALDVMLQSSLPSIGGTELGSISACMIDGSHRTASGSVPSSIMALDRLQLTYSVEWPLNLVINSSSLAAYNSIMVFLMQIKRAKCALDHMRDKPLETPLRLGVRISSSESGMEVKRHSSVSDRYGRWNTQYLLLRAELRHVVNNVENYVMSQIHGTAASNLERQLLEATALDQVRHLFRGMKICRLPRA